MDKKGYSCVDKPHIVAKMDQTETWMPFFKGSEDDTHALLIEVQE
ncbi:hypothetical protein ACFOU2_18325 [Bacillus songklensis]|uniref:Transposase n=1 Tax=Bacillus songklensis TaxID=1069116 RepID=A0ABV8B4S9_9BACI